MRILFEHMIGVLAPIDQVTRSDWFVAERPDNLPTRSQRIVFAIQGGLADSLVRETLDIDVMPLRKRLIRAVDDLSKHVHGREDTVVENEAEQNTAAQAAIETLNTFLDTYHECRMTILNAIQEELDDAAENALITDTIMEVDELASHHSVDEVYVDKTSVRSIGPHSIIYRAEGSIAVTLQWGSNSDVRRGDGLEADHSFNFHCDIEVQLDDPFNLTYCETSCNVDTGKWRKAMEPDDDDFSC